MALMPKYKTNPMSEKKKMVKGMETSIGKIVLMNKRKWIPVAAKKSQLVICGALWGQESPLRRRGTSDGATMI